MLVVGRCGGLGAPIPASLAPGLAPGAAGMYVVTVVGGDGNKVVVVPIGTVVGVVVEVGGTLMGAVGMPPIKPSTMSTYDGGCTSSAPALNLINLNLYILHISSI